MDTGHRILQMANDVAVRDGVINVTLEAVAKEAGLSKGGLLYHFPNKEVLVAGLIAHLTEQSDESLDDVGYGHPSGADPSPTNEPGSFTRAFIEATFDAMPSPRRSHAGLLAAVLLNPKLLDQFRQKYAEWHEKIQKDGLEPALASLLRYAADGLWASELLHLAPPSGELRKRVQDLMLHLTRGTESDGPPQPTTPATKPRFGHRRGAPRPPKPKRTTPTTRPGRPNRSGRPRQPAPAAGNGPAST